MKADKSQSLQGRSASRRPKSVVDSVVLVQSPADLRLRKSQCVSLNPNTGES